MAIVSGDPAPAAERPNIVPAGIMICDWTPARTCERDILRVTLFWLTGNASLSAAAVAGANSSIVGMLRYSSAEWRPLFVGPPVERASERNGGRAYAFQGSRFTVLVAPMHTNPDLAIDRKLPTSPICGSVLSAASQTPQQVYEPLCVTAGPRRRAEVRRLGVAANGRRPRSRRGLMPAYCSASPSPPRRSICFTAIGRERLTTLMGELFGLTISDGAIGNLLVPVREPLLDVTAATEKIVLPCPASAHRRDFHLGQRQVRPECSRRLMAQRSAFVPNGCSSARSRFGIRSTPATARPWRPACAARSDRGVGYRICWESNAATPPLAGVPGASDTRREYAIHDGDTAIGAPLQPSLSRAMAIGNRRETSKDATFQRYMYNLDRPLDRIMAVVPIKEAAGRERHERVLATGM